MNASGKLNEIAKIRRCQHTKARIAYGYGLGPENQIRANKLRFCGSWLYLREFLETGEAKVLNALLCKQFHLCEVCAVRRQAKMAAASRPKVEKVMSNHPELIPAMITRTIKSGPDLSAQADHFRTSRTKMLERIRRAKSASCRNQRTFEMGKVAGQIRSFEAKKAKGNSDHWHFHEHIFALLSERIDVEKLSDEWHEVTGDSFIVDVRGIRAKNEDCDAVGSALAEVIKYPLKFAGLTPADAWHANSILVGSRMTESLGLLRGVRIGDLETDFPLDDETGPYRDFIAKWIESRSAFDLETVEDYGEALTSSKRPKHAREQDNASSSGQCGSVPEEAERQAEAL